MAKGTTEGKKAYYKLGETAHVYVDVSAGLNISKNCPGSTTKMTRQTKEALAAGHIVRIDEDEFDEMMETHNGHNAAAIKETRRKKREIFREEAAGERELDDDEDLNEDEFNEDDDEKAIDELTKSDIQEYAEKTLDEDDLKEFNELPGKDKALLKKQKEYLKSKLPE